MKSNGFLYLSFYAIQTMMMLIFLLFTMRKNLLDLPLLFQMPRPFMSASLPLCLTCEVTAMAKKSLKN